VHCSKFQNVEPFTVNGLWKPLEIVICFTGTKKQKTNKQTKKQQPGNYTQEGFIKNTGNFSRMLFLNKYLMDFQGEVITT